jgi:hypothetical protein
MLTITITENNDEIGDVVRYQQTVDFLDIRKVIEAVNDSPPPAPPAVRKRARRSDAGKPKARKLHAGDEGAEPNPFEEEVK